MRHPAPLLTGKLTRLRHLVSSSSSSFVSQRCSRTPTTSRSAVTSISQDTASRNHSYGKIITGTSTEVNSRQTLRAAFWTHMLFDSLGVRSAADLALLSPWMFIKGGMARDIDSSLQHLMSSFGDKSEISLTTHDSAPRCVLRLQHPHQCREAHQVSPSRRRRTAGNYERALREWSRRGGGGEGGDAAADDRGRAGRDRAVPDSNYIMLFVAAAG